MQNTNLVYFSASGTTKTVATILADSLGAAKTEFDLLRNCPEQPITVEADTPAVFAVPVFSGRIPSSCVDALKQFKGERTPAIAVVVYGNREYDDALLELTDILKAHDFVVVAAAAFVAQHSIFPAVGEGRPDQKDKDAIEEFGKKCKASLESFTGAEAVVVKGNTPYLTPSAIPLRPAGSSKCNACETCAAICPTKAISAATPRKSDKTRCISCTACIAACPQKARQFSGFLYSLAGKAFTKQNTSRREPEYFYSEVS